MTRKQIRKLANEVYECELIHQSESTSEEEKKRADNRVIQIIRQIMALKNGGPNLLLEIDAMVQEIREKSNTLKEK